jgi:hypothetical protein
MLQEGEYVVAMTLLQNLQMQITFILTIHTSVEERVYPVYKEEELSKLKTLYAPVTEAFL